MGRIKCAVWVFVLVAVVVAAVGCTGLPGRPTQVKQLQAEIAVMPGVESFSASYSNNITHGAVLDLWVRMPGASEDQIAAVARRINEIKADYFEGYDQTTEFIVGERLKVRRGERLDPDQVAADARGVRQIGGALPGTEVSWFRGKVATITLNHSPAAAESLAAVRPVIGTDALGVDILPAGDAPMWWVGFPLTAEREQQLLTLVNGLPVQVLAVRIEDGHMSNMSVGVRDPASAYADLAAAIAALQPTTRHPMLLRWSGTRGPDGKSFSGSVHVGGCSYGTTAGEQDPESYYPPEAIDVQRRLREQFDTCQ
ncbi:hypothetical protein [Nocardia cyriacigeorgica]|uniref:hypothetical protein n=1 Tax=Nocardia cyriacigeorgica TaxID=135487 RepID=UPI001894EDB5|nr:hypothetical protein [Nocardia cyriacigeorgica]MBF6437985.1 hypothetical protein [Nocardia cyriacigeorgica]MBF6453534.1 hypothetical protein [Nocardia cyriacigeorgica]MBF6478173.1 hypothetical protein [Nocardia cyriacigeorgica]MBF6550703.1 hypothetical protein [Nocardia cyriacigeorgica]